MENSLIQKWTATAEQASNSQKLYEAFDYDAYIALSDAYTFLTPEEKKD